MLRPPSNSSVCFGEKAPRHFARYRGAFYVRSRGSRKRSRGMPKLCAPRHDRQKRVEDAHLHEKCRRAIGVSGNATSLVISGATRRNAGGAASTALAQKPISDVTNK